MLSLLSCLVCILLLSAGLVLGVHDSLKFFIEPQQRVCFYEDFDKIAPVRTIEAFVQSGGDLDIHLSIHGPLELDDVRLEVFEKLIVQEVIDMSRETLSESQTFVMDFKPKLSGTYGICLDNRYDKKHSKLVHLDVRQVEKPEPEVVHLSLKKGGSGSSKTVDESDKALQNVRDSLTRLKHGVHNILKQQQRDRHRLSLHSETNKLSHDEVVWDSLVETIAFIATACFQVFFVRRWFVNKMAGGSRV